MISKARSGISRFKKPDSSSTGTDRKELHQIAVQKCHSVTSSDRDIPLPSGFLSSVRRKALLQIVNMHVAATSRQKKMKRELTKTQHA